MEKGKKNGGKKKIIIFVIIGVLIAGVGGYFGYTKFIAKPAKTPQVAALPQQGQVAPQQGQVAQPANGQQPVNAQQPVVPAVVSEKTFGLDEVLVNLADEDGKAYLKVKVFIGYDDKKLDKELEEKKPILRDAVISVLRGKKSTDISQKGLDAIKSEILARVIPVLHKGAPNNIYFYDILLQK